MITRFQNAGDKRGRGEEGKNTEIHSRTDGEETCRCKETSKMSAGELLKLMMKDLAVWKKAKKE